LPDEQTIAQMDILSSRSGRAGDRAGKGEIANRAFSSQAPFVGRACAHGTGSRQLLPFYEFDEHEFFRSDGAPEEIAARRRRGFMRLAQLYRERFGETRRLTTIARESISDLQFTDAYRVPFQYSRIVREHLRAGSFLQSSRA
jgi:hypothetical protein